jgi:hypothetical protein
MTWGGGMAAAFYVLFPAFFCAGVRVVFQEAVDWPALLVIAAPCAAAFGLAMAVWVWRTEEADYRHTPPHRPERDDVAGD